MNAKRWTLISIVVVFALVMVLVTRRRDPAAQSAHRSPAIDAPSVAAPHHTPSINETSVARHPAESRGRDEPRKPRPDFALVDGIVKLLDTDAAVSEGSVDLGFVDLVALDFTVDDLGSMLPEARQELERRVAAEISSDGHVRLELPTGALVAEAVVTPRVTSGDFRRSYLTRRERRTDRPLENGEIRQLEFYVQQGFVVRGAVIDANTRAPIAGARVERPSGMQPLNESSDELQTDNEGRFEFAIVPTIVSEEPMSFEMTIVHPSHQAVRARFSNDAFAYEMNLPRIELHEGVVVRGRVVDRQGAGVWAVVRAFRYADRRSSWGRALDFSVMTAAHQDGSFQLPAIPSCNDVVVTVDCSESGSSEATLRLRHR
ncbi:MAG: hypothetical protein HYR85_22410 [Planctomycetes bacterium]|nr:hypothetical protein [Planctomycetota bacterium]